MYGQIGPVYPPNGGQKDDPEAFYGSHTPTGAIPTENEPRPATSSRLLYPQSTLRSVKALRDKEEYPLRLLKSRCDPGCSVAEDRVEPRWVTASYDSAVDDILFHTPERRKIQGRQSIYPVPK